MQFVLVSLFVVQSLSEQFYQDQQGQIKQIDKNIQEFLEWAKINGARFPKIEIFHIDEKERGTVATDKILAGEQIMFLPKNIFITNETAYNQSNLIPKFLQNYENSEENYLSINIFLNEIKNTPQHHFKPYIDVLPTSFDQFPLYFSDYQLELLQNSSLRDDIIDLRLKLMKEYDQLIVQFPELEFMSFEDFKWGYQICQSRIFSLYIDDQYDVGIVPLADFMNSKKHSNTQWRYDQEQGGFVVESYNFIKSGEEISCSYGTKYSKKYLELYGFFDESNYLNQVDINFCLSQNDPYYELKINQLKKECDIFKIYNATSKQSFPFLSILSTARFLVIDTQEEAAKIEKMLLKKNYTEISAFSQQNEIKALEYLSDLAEVQLSYYQTTVDEDLKLIREGKNIVNQNILKLRCSEKQLLIQFSREMNFLLELYETDHKYIKGQLENYYYSKYSEYEDYYLFYHQLFQPLFFGLMVSLIKIQIRLKQNTLVMMKNANKINYKRPKNNNFKYLIFQLKINIKFVQLPLDHPEQLKINTFYQWLKERGAKFRKIEIVYFGENYRGVAAKKNLKQGDNFLFIPKDLMISKGFVANVSQSLKEVLEIFQNETWVDSALIGLFFLENRENPNYKPLIDMFPKDFNTFPIYFNQDHIQLLQNSSFIEEIREINISINSYYEQILKNFPEYVKYTIEEFKWAYLICQSRCFHLKINETTKIDVIVPLADMINYRSHVTSIWSYDNQKEGFIMQATEEIYRGIEISDSYGQRNKRLNFIQYGFIDDSSDESYTGLNFCLDEKDPFYDFKFKHFNQNCHVWHFSNSTDDDQFFRMLSRGRLLMVDNVKDAVLVDKMIENGRVRYLSHNNEVRMINFFRDLTEQQLKYYQTTIEQDEDLLAKEADWTNQNIIKLRLLEKLLLKSLNNQFKLLLELYKNTQELRQRMLESDPQLMPFYGYLKSVYLNFE